MVGSRRDILSINGGVHRLVGIDRKNWIVHTEDITGYHEFTLYISPAGKMGLITDKNDVIPIRTSFATAVKNRILLGGN